MKSEKLIGTRSDFEAFLLSYDNHAFRQRISDGSGKPLSEINTILDTYFSEMRFGYGFLEEHIPGGRLRILEVGAGLGLLSIYLKQLGHEAIALEPAGLSFGIFESTKKLIWDDAGIEMPQLLEITAEELEPSKHGKFDFIFSINVMEHIADIDKATDSVMSVLSCNGQCVNACPNYWVPYEPHYAIPMVPFAHKITKKLFSETIHKQPDIWTSLNFISWGKVRSMAKRNNATVEFEKRLIYKSFERLGQDAEFRARHKNGFAGKLYRFLSATRLLGVLKLIPSALSTPMIFTYRHKQ